MTCSGVLKMAGIRPRGHEISLEQAERGRISIRTRLAEMSGVLRAGSSDRRAQDPTHPRRQSRGDRHRAHADGRVREARSPLSPRRTRAHPPCRYTDRPARLARHQARRLKQAEGGPAPDALRPASEKGFSRRGRSALRRLSAEEQAPFAGKDFEDVPGRDRQSPSPEQAAAHYERIRAVDARKEAELVDNAELSAPDLNTEALAARKPIDRIG
jgi:hypothetical protein